MRHDNKLVTNISLKVKKELPHSKEFTVLFYFIAYTDLYLLINRSIRCLLTGVIMYTVGIYMEKDENMILQVLTFQKKILQVVSFYRKGCAPSPWKGQESSFSLKAKAVHRWETEAHPKAGESVRF